MDKLSSDGAIEDKAIDLLEFLSTDDAEDADKSKSDKDDKDDKIELDEKDEELSKLATEDDDDEDDSDKDETETDDKKDKKLELKDKEEDEIDDEELDSEAIFINRKNILKKYPNLFKEFPALNRAYYREQKFSEIFPSIEDAKTSKEQLESYGQYASKIGEGDLTDVIGLVKQNNPQAYAKLVDNYLPTLYKADQQAYYHIIGNTAKQIIGEMAREGQNSKSDALKAAAVVLNQFMFGSSQYTPPQNLSNPNEPNGGQPNQDQQLSQERQQFLQERFNHALGDITSRVDNTLTATINEYIDPKKSMSSYVRKNAVKDCIESVKEQIDNDSVFRARFDKLWENAVKNNFNRASMDKIKGAYLSRAKTILPDSIKRIRSEALRGLGGRKQDKENEEPIKRGTSTSGNSGKKLEKPKGMSTEDFFMMD